MPDFRRIDIPEKDRPLRADVSLLGTLLGDVLAEQHGVDEAQVLVTAGAARHWAATELTRAQFVDNLRNVWKSAGMS